LKEEEGNGWCFSAEIVKKILRFSFKNRSLEQCDTGSMDSEVNFKK
jgi:hypothetical protein